MQWVLNIYLRRVIHLQVWFWVGFKVCAYYLKMWVISYLPFWKITIIQNINPSKLSWIILWSDLPIIVNSLKSNKIPWQYGLKSFRTNFLSPQWERKNIKLWAKTGKTLKRRTWTFFVFCYNFLFLNSVHRDE